MAIVNDVAKKIVGIGGANGLRVKMYAGLALADANGFLDHAVAYHAKATILSDTGVTNLLVTALSLV